MTRFDLLISDEFIDVTVECEIRSGIGIKQMREQISKQWKLYRDELKGIYDSRIQNMEYESGNEDAVKDL